MNPANNESNEPSFWRRPAGMLLVTVAIIAGFFFLREHWGHVFGYWPYLLLLACPLMHLMHEKSHGGHSSHLQDSGRTHNGQK